MKEGGAGGEDWTREESGLFNRFGSVEEVQLPSAAENVFLLLTVVLASGCGALSLIQLLAQRRSCLGRFSSCSGQYVLHVSHALLGVMTAITALPAIASVSEPTISPPPAAAAAAVAPPPPAAAAAAADHSAGQSSWHPLFTLVPLTLLASSCHCLLQLLTQLAADSCHCGTVRLGRHCGRILSLLITVQWIISWLLAYATSWQQQQQQQQHRSLGERQWLAFALSPLYNRLLTRITLWLMSMSGVTLALLALRQLIGAKRRGTRRQQQMTSGTATAPTSANSADKCQQQLPEAQSLLVADDSAKKLATHILVTMTSTSANYDRPGKRRSSRPADTEDGLALCTLQLILTAAVHLTFVLISRANLATHTISMDSHPDDALDRWHEQQTLSRAKWIVLVQIGCRLVQLVASLVQNQQLGDDVMQWLRGSCCCCRGHNLVRPLTVPVLSAETEDTLQIEESAAAATATASDSQ